MTRRNVPGRTNSYRMGGDEQRKADALGIPRQRLWRWRKWISGEVAEGAKPTWKQKAAVRKIDREFKSRDGANVSEPHGIKRGQVWRDGDGNGVTILNAEQCSVRGVVYVRDVLAARRSRGRVEPLSSFIGASAKYRLTTEG